MMSAWAWKRVLFCFVCLFYFILFYFSDTNCHFVPESMGSYGAKNGIIFVLVMRCQCRVLVSLFTGSLGVVGVSLY
jgi:hypothetical protein